ncbi:MAG: hypothetical protein HFG20_07185 [Anaerotruncus sp.]|jgi:hypothetical protein|nr:hypothetical protein [Anaerotruncus sp.]
MFTIKRIEDPRLSARVCGSYGLDEPGMFAYAACENGQVLATAAFVLRDGCATLCGVDTGKRTDLALIDGMARAAFSAQLRAGVQQARLDDSLPEQLRLALTKRGYTAQGAFSLEAFFAHRNCRK